MMFTTPLNQRTVTAKLKRIEICDLLIACTVIADAAQRDGETGQKWIDLHDKLRQILDDFDAKQNY